MKLHFWAIFWRTIAFSTDKQNSKHWKTTSWQKHDPFRCWCPRVKEEVDLGSPLVTGTAKRPEVPGAGGNFGKFTNYLKVQDT